MNEAFKVIIIKEVISKYGRENCYKPCIEKKEFQCRTSLYTADALLHIVKCF